MFESTIFAIDTHTAGEPTRVVVGGLPFIPGNSMKEKLQHFRNKLDSIRKSLLFEPRGHRNMFGAVVTDPVTKGANFGVIFMSPTIFPEMSGHGSIGVVTALVDTGIVKAKDPVTEVFFDTVSGLVKAEAKIESGALQSVTIHNVPSFLLSSTTVQVSRIGEIPVDISFGGKFFAIVSAEDLGEKVEPGNLPRLIDAGLRVRDAVNSQIKAEHPEKPYIGNSTLSVQIYDRPTHPDAHSKNIVVAKGGTNDRSPCGTGTSARMATLYAKGELGLNEDFVYESIIGTVFRGKLVSESKVGKLDAVVPQITGSAYVTALCTFIISPNDPLKTGFLLPPLKTN